MKTEDLNYIGNDPGAVKHGNFINYYAFHSAKERIDNFNEKMFPEVNGERVLCLDVGCNTGELTAATHDYLQTVYPNSEIFMLGMDIDPCLIQRAQEANANPNITYVSENIMTEKGKQILKDFLDTHQQDKFDVIFCFSVTMWIHINNGDDGLKQFLQHIQLISRTIVIEPQPWNCYRNAQRRVKKSGSSFPLYESLQIRSNVDTVIENILNETTHQKVYEALATWNRKLQSYQLMNKLLS